ncbi:MAG TPA: hypothetical protein VFI71_09975 [Pyrinomonadaceae bacterium]|nr:hypothetical protein [Pyrinomonadaceae bacterium]
MRNVALLLVCLLLLSDACSQPSVSQDNVATANANANASVTPAASPTPSETSTIDPASIVLTVPVGEGGITYADAEVEELEPWGSSAFEITDDGTYLIADAVGKRILRYRADGSQLPAFPVKDVVGITDIAASLENIYLLDKSSAIPSIVRLSNEGVVEAQTPSTLIAGLKSRAAMKDLSGVATAADGDVLLEFEPGVEMRRFNNVRALDRSLRGNNYSVSVPTLQRQLVDGGKGSVLRNGSPFIEIKVDNLLAELRVLTVNSAGEIFVVVDEIVPTSQVDVDETVRRYRADGTLLSTARVPIHDMYFQVANNLRVNQQGEIIAKVPRRKDTVFVKLKFESELAPILTKTTFDPATPAPAPEGTCRRTRAQMIAMAKTYINNKVSLSLANLSGTDCQGRKKPKYLGDAAGEYNSVAYDWGGSDTPERYNQHMAENRAAGDTDAHAVENCSSGVDCSGFVTRCWGFTDPGQRFETASLPSISVAISILQLQPGDILNKPHRHVVLFDRFDEGQSRDGNGLMAYESTTTQGSDRVIHGRTNWRRWLGYTAMRYKRVC